MWARVARYVPGRHGIYWIEYGRSSEKEKPDMVIGFSSTRIDHQPRQSHFQTFHKDVIVLDVHSTPSAILHKNTASRPVDPMALCLSWHSS